MIIRPFAIHLLVYFLYLFGVDEITLSLNSRECCDDPFNPIQLIPLLIAYQFDDKKS